MREDEDGGYGERKKRKGGKRKRKDKKNKAYSELEEEAYDDRDVENDRNIVNDLNDEGAAADAQDHLLAAGLEDSDVEDVGDMLN